MFQLNENMKLAICCAPRDGGKEILVDLRADVASGRRELLCRDGDGGVIIINTTISSK